MIDQEAVICASNNVHWYEAIFRSHGLTGTTADGIWTSRDSAPPYYSNAVTVAPSGISVQVANLKDLGETLRQPWSVKDSFSMLELAPLGFRPLFEAEWIWRDAADAPIPGRGDSTWRRVTTADELERWEGAWRENGSPTDSPVFVPDLLADPTIALFAAYRGGAIVAGCAANRSIDAVGFSNFFVAGGDEDLLMAGAVSEVARFGAGLPVVGYEAGEMLARSRGLGFRTVGPLRVWLNDVQ
jgi:hypothetical protein